MRLSSSLKNLGLVCALVAVAVFAVDCKKKSSSKSGGGGGPGPNPPTVLDANPKTGLTTGGTPVTITTENFTDDFLVDLPDVFFGADQSPSVVASNATTIRADSPAVASAGVVDIRVDSTGVVETATLAAIFDYTTQPPPVPCQLSSVSPGSGFTDVQTPVAIIGTNLPTSGPLPTVEFGLGNPAVPGSVQFVAVNRIDATAPLNPVPGSVDVIVTPATGPACSLPSAFLYVQPPPPPSCNISFIDPTFGPDTGRNAVDIFGSGFTLTSNVTFGGVDVTGTMQFRDPTWMTVDAPAGVGLASIIVNLGGGITCDLIGGYNFISCGGPGCNITQVNPNTAGVGDTVDISGTGFEVGAQVFFDTAGATVQSVTPPSLITVTVPNPPGGSLTVDVQVINPSGACCTDNNGFTYGGCTVTDVAPNTGPDTGGQNVAITWSGCDFSSLPTVLFDTAPANVVQATDTTILCVTPPGNGLVDITVTDASGNVGILTGAYTYGGCLITSLVPNSGGTNGGTDCILTGSGYDQTVLITFGSIFLDVGMYTVDPTNTQITLKTPPSQFGGTVTVTVESQIAQVQCSTQFTYNLPGGGNCSITDIQPATGDTQGGTVVTISGTGFDAGAGVLFGCLPGNVTFADPTTIIVTTPPYCGPQGNPPPPVDVVVAPANSDPCVRAGGFQHVMPSCPGGCALTSASPNNGPQAGLNVITLNGSGLCSVSTIVFGTELGVVVSVDPSGNSMTVEVPAAPTAGPVDIWYIDPMCMTSCMGCYTYN